MVLPYWEQHQEEMFGHGRGCNTKNALRERRTKQWACLVDLAHDLISQASSGAGEQDSARNGQLMEAAQCCIGAAIKLKSVLDCSPM